MKTIFSNKHGGKVSPLYILFALAVLSFVALFFYAHLISEDVVTLVLFISAMAMIFLGGLIIEKRGGPPW